MSSSGFQLAPSFNTDAVVRLEVRIAAGDDGGQHRLAGGEIENARVRGFEDRVAQLLDRTARLPRGSS